jgi:hypothetical protein
MTGVVSATQRTRRLSKLNGKCGWFRRPAAFAEGVCGRIHTAAHESELASPWANLRQDCPQYGFLARGQGF